eukprot:Hpha_TRINITY_DN16288_c2_g1::TRINITY_DN16288_c2_g1_i1::g.13334::m.13334
MRSPLFLLLLLVCGVKADDDGEDHRLAAFCTASVTILLCACFGFMKGCLVPPTRTQSGLRSVAAAAIAEVAVWGCVSLCLFVAELSGFTHKVSRGAFGEDKADDIDEVIRATHLVLLFLALTFALAVMCFCYVISKACKQWQGYEDAALDDWTAMRVRGMPKPLPEPLTCLPWWWGGTAGGGVFVLARHALLRDAHTAKMDLTDRDRDDGEARDLSVPNSVDRRSHPLTFGGTTGQLGELSALYAPACFVSGGHSFPSLEHWYQAQRYRPRFEQQTNREQGVTKRYFEMVRQQKTPIEARQLAEGVADVWKDLKGRTATKPHPDPRFQNPHFRVKVMLRGARALYRQNATLRDALLGTRNRYLLCTEVAKEDAAPFWGIAEGEKSDKWRAMMQEDEDQKWWNVLGKILMQVREELRDEIAGGEHLGDTFSLSELVNFRLWARAEETVRLDPVVWGLVFLCATAWWMISWHASVRVQGAVWASVHCMVAFGLWFSVASRRQLTVGSLEQGEFPPRPWYRTLFAREFLRVGVVIVSMHVAMSSAIYIPTISSTSLRNFSIVIEAVAGLFDLALLFPTLLVERALADCTQLSRSGEEVRIVQCRDLLRHLLRVLAVAMRLQQVSKSTPDPDYDDDDPDSPSPPRSPAK